MAKSNLPLLIARLIRATGPAATFLEFPRGADVYTGGWDGIVKCGEETAFVPEGISLWEMGTESDVKGKADEDFEKRLSDPLRFVPSECVFVFVTTRKWTQKAKWVRAKKALGKWKDVKVYDSINLDQWLSDAPAVGWWLSVISGNLPPEGIMSAEQVWKEYAVSPNHTLAPSVLTCSRAREKASLCEFLSRGPGLLSVQARSRDEATAFIIASALEQEVQRREDFFTRALVIENVTSFRTIANNRTGLILIAKFTEMGPLNTAVENGHQVLVPLGADDTYSAGKPLSLSQLGRELEGVLIASGFSQSDATKHMIESGRDITILRRLLDFPQTSIQWADAKYASLLLPALFLGRWDENKEGDIAIMEALAGEPYATYVEKLNRWRDDPHPFVYQIGSCWRLASPLDAWSLLARSITKQQLVRLEKTVITVLGQAKPMFELEPEKRFMAAMYGKAPIHSKWAREGVSQSLILLALFGALLRIPVENAQQWVDRVVGELLGSRDPNVWRSLNDVMPLLAEASPERFLSIVYASLFDNADIVMGMFEEDPSPLMPRSYHTGLLWALEALSWFEPYLERVTWILCKLAENDPGGAISNRPANSFRAIYLPWYPQTFVDHFKRNAILADLVKRNVATAWKLFVPLLPESHGHAGQSNRTRWREFGVENVHNPTTWPQAWETYSLLLELMIPLAGNDEKKIALLVAAAENMTPNDRNRLFTHLETIANDIPQTEYSIVAALRQTLRHHRQFPDANWALPESELTSYDRLLAMLQPETTAEKYRFLFEENYPSIPEMNQLDPNDFEAEERFIHDKRIEATKTIYAEMGMGKILEWAQTVTEKVIFGNTLAFCLTTDSEQLQIIQQEILEAPHRFNAAAGLTRTSTSLHGLSWVTRFYRTLQESGVPDAKLAVWLSWMPFSSELYQWVEKQDDAIVAGYWQNCDLWVSQLSDPEKIGTIEHLLQAARYATALQQINLFAAGFPTPLIMRCLEGLATDPAGDRRLPRNYEIERVMQELYNRNDYDRNEMGKLEWFCLPIVSILNRSNYTRILQEELMLRPSFFVEMLQWLYRPRKNDEQGEAPIEKEAEPIPPGMAMRAHDLLKDWSRIPGLAEDGSLDGDTLNAWVEEARTLAQEKSRLEVADVHIGKLLSHYPGSDVGQKPPDPVCRVIDHINTRPIRSGFYSGMFDKKSSSTRGVFDGGDRERQIAATYKEVADKLLLHWPVTASIFESLVASYAHDAARQDEEAQRDSLDS